MKPVKHCFSKQEIPCPTQTTSQNLHLLFHSNPLFFFEFLVLHTVAALDLSSRKSFFVGLPGVETVNDQAKDWILNNTTFDDYFFVTAKDKSFIPQEKASNIFTQRLHFIVYYRRFTPLLFSDFQPQLQHPYYAIPEERISSITKARITCDNESLQNLNIKYIYFTPQWPEGLMEKCLENNDLDLVFQSGENKIYKLK